MIIAELNNGTSCEKRYYLQQNLYNFLGKKYKKFYFINTHNVFNKKKLKINHNFFKKKNIIHFSPKNIGELNEFLSKNDIFLINNLSFQFKHIFFHYLVSKKNIFQISFSNIFQFASYRIENWIYADFTRKIKFLFTKKISLILHRILVILRIINQIDILYIAKKNVFKKYSSSYNKKVFFIKKYKHIKTTSVKLPLFQNIKKQLTKYITFIDTGIMHVDISKRGYLINNKMAKNYFSFLKTYLIKLNKVLKKEIIICLHPSSSYNLYKKELGEFKIYKYKTEKYISNSFLVLFHDTSAILSAILLKKKIIQLKSNILGPYLNARRFFYLKNFTFLEHDIQQNLKVKKKMLTEKLNKNIKNYDKSIRKIYYTDKDSLPIEKIIDFEIQKFINK